MVVLTPAAMTQPGAGWVAVVFDTWLSEQKFLSFSYSFWFYSFGCAVPNAVIPSTGCELQAISGVRTGVLCLNTRRAMLLVGPSPMESLDELLKVGVILLVLRIVIVRWVYYVLTILT